MERSLEAVWVGLHVEWGRVSRNHKSRVNCVSQVNGNSDAYLHLHAGRRKNQLRNNGVCQPICLGEAVPPAFSLKPGNSVFSCVSLSPFELLLQHWSSEWVCQWVGLHVNPLRGMPGTPASHCLTQSQSPLVFTARGHRDFSSRHWNPGLGRMIWGWDHLLLR